MKRKIILIALGTILAFMLLLILSVTTNVATQTALADAYYCVAGDNVKVQICGYPWTDPCPPNLRDYVFTAPNGNTPCYVSIVQWPSDPYARWYWYFMPSDFQHHWFDCTVENGTIIIKKGTEHWRRQLDKRKAEIHVGADCSPISMLEYYYHPQAPTPTLAPTAQP